MHCPCEDNFSASDFYLNLYILYFPIVYATIQVKIFIKFRIIFIYLELFIGDKNEEFCYS